MNRRAMRLPVRSSLLLLLAGLLVFGHGCGRKPAGGASGSASVLRYPLIEEPASLDPAVIVSADTNEMIYNVFEGLVRYDREMKLVPWLADSWEISKDRKTYTFRLNPNAKFHAPYSRPVTAADVKWSIERILRPETKSTVLAAMLTEIEGAKAMLEGRAQECSGVRVIDPRTVAISTDTPRAYMLQELGAPVFCREAIEKEGGKVTVRSAIGTGPFVVKEYRPGSAVVLEANPDYYRGRPKLDRIERPILLDSQTAHIAFENGETHIARISAADYVEDRKSSRLKDQTLLMDWAGTSFLAMQRDVVPAFQDRRVRRAIAEAIDRDRINQIAYLGTRVTARSFLPPGVLGHNPDVRAIPFDPEHARKLLAEAGYPGGRRFPRLTLEYVQHNPGYSGAANVIRDNLRENLGIEVDLREREAGSFFADIEKKRIGFHLSGWNTMDPHDFLALLMRTGARYNSLGYSNPRFDALVDRADAEFDTEKRAALYRQADQVQLDDAAVLPINYNRVAYLVHPSIKDLDYNLGGLMPHFRTRMGR